MYKKILVPLDGSWPAEGILPYARLLARALKIPVELLQVIDPETLQMYRDLAPFFSPEPKDLYHRSVIGAYLDRLALSFDDKASVARSIETGQPAEVIVDKAAEDPDTLVAMCTHGHSGVQRWFLGSVTEQVLHAARNHLLLIRRQGNGGEARPVGLKTAVIPLDGSTLAEKILMPAASLARSLDLEVLLVRVYDVPMTSYYATEDYLPEPEGIARQLEETAMSYLETKAGQLRARGLERVATVAVRGNPADKIVDLALRTPDNLVMMCTHGRSGIGRWVLGSVASRVVRHSNDPVLVVRPGDQPREALRPANAEAWTDIQR